MGRLSRPTILLIVTGAIAGAFWPLVGLFLGLNFIIPLWAALAYLADLIAFMILLIAAFGRKVRHDIKRVQDYRVVKCSICDETLPEASLRQFARTQGPHYRSVHSEMWKWNRKWRKLFITAYGCIFVYFAWAMVYVFSNAGNFLLLLLLLPAIPPAFLMGVFSKRKREQFRKDWKNRTMSG